MRVVQLGLIVLSAVLLAGCPKKPQTLPEGGPAQTESSGATTSGTSGNDVSALSADQQAIEALTGLQAEHPAEAPAIQTLLDFLRASSRGIARP